MTPDERFSELAKQRLSDVIDWLGQPDNKVPITEEGMSDLGARLLGAVLVAHREVRKPAYAPKRLVVKAQLL